MAPRRSAVAGPLNLGEAIHHIGLDAAGVLYVARTSAPVSTCADRTDSSACGQMGLVSELRKLCASTCQSWSALALVAMVWSNAMCIEFLAFLASGAAASRPARARISSIRASAFTQSAGMPSTPTGCGQPAGDCRRGIGVFAKIDRRQHRVAVAARPEQAPQAGLEGVYGVAIAENGIFGQIDDLAAEIRWKCGSSAAKGGC